MQPKSDHTAVVVCLGAAHDQLTVALRASFQVATEMVDATWLDSAAPTPLTFLKGMRDSVEDLAPSRDPDRLDARRREQHLTPAVDTLCHASDTIGSE